MDTIAVSSKKARRPNLPPWPKAQTERGPNGRLLCRCGCGREVKPPRRSWYSPECLERVRLNCDWSYVKKHVYARDKGLCRCCGIHAEAFRAEVREAFATGNLIPLEEAKTQGWPALHRPWQQVDHIVPVCQGGAQLDRSNLRTVCVPCHKKLTAALNRERRAAKAAAKAASIPSTLPVSVEAAA